MRRLGVLGLGLLLMSALSGCGGSSQQGATGTRSHHGIPSSTGPRFVGETESQETVTARDLRYAIKKKVHFVAGSSDVDQIEVVYSENGQKYAAFYRPVTEQERVLGAVEISFLVRETEFTDLPYRHVVYLTLIDTEGNTSDYAYMHAIIVN